MIVARLLRWIGVAALLAVSVPVFAAEPPHAGEAQVSIFAGSLGNALVTLIVFLIVVYILAKTAWRPLLKVLNERERTIRESIETARQEREQAQRLLADYQKQLEQARAAATAIVEEGRRDAEGVRQRLVDEARNEAEAQRERALREIRLATDSAIKELYDQTAELAVMIARSALRKSLSEDDQRRLVEESIAQMKNVDRTRLN